MSHQAFCAKAAEVCLKNKIVFKGLALMIGHFT